MTDCYSRTLMVLSAVGGVMRKCRNLADFGRGAGSGISACLFIKFKARELIG